MVVDTLEEAMTLVEEAREQTAPKVNRSDWQCSRNLPGAGYARGNAGCCH